MLCERDGIRHNVGGGNEIRSEEGKVVGQEGPLPGDPAEGPHGGLLGGVPPNPQSGLRGAGRSDPSSGLQPHVSDQRGSSCGGLVGGLSKAGDSTGYIHEFHERSTDGEDEGQRSIVAVLEWCHVSAPIYSTI